MGETLGRVPHVRTVFDLAAAVAGPVALHSGAVSLERGLVRNDAAQRFAGKMRLAQAFSYLFKAAAPVGLAASIAHGVYRSRVASGSLTPEAAERKADGWLALTSGPVGAAGLAVAGQLERDAAVSPPEAVSRIEAKRGTGALTAAAVTLVAAQAGQMAGALAGTALGGVAGAFVGAWWGYVGGGIVGVAGVSAVQTLLRSKTEGEERLRSSDARYLAGVTGGAGVGAALGTSAGLAGGAAVGSWVGGAVAGPLGATVGSLIAQMATIPFLAGQGAKQGAALGARLAA